MSIITVYSKRLDSYHECTLAEHNAAKKHHKDDPGFDWVIKERAAKSVKKSDSVKDVAPAASKKAPAAKKTAARKK